MLKTIDIKTLIDTRPIGLTGKTLRDFMEDKPKEQMKLGDEEDIEAIIHQVFDINPE